MWVHKVICRENTQQGVDSEERQTVTRTSSLIVTDCSLNTDTRLKTRVLNKKNIHEAGISFFVSCSIWNTRLQMEQDGGWVSRFLANGLRCPVTVTSATQTDDRNKSEAHFHRQLTAAQFVTERVWFSPTSCSQCCLQHMIHVFIPFNWLNSTQPCEEFFSISSPYLVMWQTSQSSDQCWPWEAGYHLLRALKLTSGFFERLFFSSVDLRACVKLKARDSSVFVTSMLSSWSSDSSSGRWRASSSSNTPDKLAAWNGTSCRSSLLVSRDMWETTMCSSVLPEKQNNNVKWKWKFSSWLSGFYSTNSPALTYRHNISAQTAST